MKKIYKQLVCLLMAMMLLCSVSVFAEGDSTYESFYYDTVLEGMLQTYPFEAETEEIARAIAKIALDKHPELLEEFINATADQFDDHTDYFTPAELDDFTGQINAEYVGIGVSVVRVEGGVAIESIFADSPAAKAGLLAGDIFLQVDGQDVADLSVTELAQLIRGISGTTVHLTMKRQEQIFDITVMRRAVQQNTVSYTVLSEDIGYVSISIFNSNTPAELKVADTHFRELGIRNLIVDLRDNPGGELLGVVGALGYFVPRGKTLVTIEYNIPGRTTSLRSVGDVVGQPYYKPVVLINGGTASAAELFAGNIRDHGIGTLVGTTSYGKGTVQEFMDLRNSGLPLGAIKITAAEYVLPGGDKVNGVGIHPDYREVNRKTLLDTSDMEPMIYCALYREGDTGPGVLALKQRFDAMGYFVGQVNDQYDRELTLAVRQIQQQGGLTVTGEMDIDTQTLFSNMVLKTRVLWDDQFDKAYELLQALQ